MAMNTSPEQRLTSSDGRKDRRNPPKKALMPSTRKKANMLPRKTCHGEELKERTIVVICVLSKSSARRMMLQAVKRGLKSNLKTYFHP
jgi:hypothetical protein